MKRDKDKCESILADVYNKYGLSSSVLVNAVKDVNNPQKLISMELNQHTMMEDIHDVWTRTLAFMTSAAQNYQKKEIKIRMWV